MGFLTKMHNSMQDLDQKYYYEYSTQPKLKKMLQDVDVYITVPLKLMNGNVQPYYSSNNAVISEIISLIDGEQMMPYKLFSDDCYRNIDFSQFKPRGHYTETYNLAHYFKAMMWLGRTEIYLNLPKAVDKFNCELQNGPGQIQTVQLYPLEFTSLR